MKVIKWEIEKKGKLRKKCQEPELLNLFRSQDRRYSFSGGQAKRLSFLL
jgi:hypothetical protein